MKKRWFVLVLLACGIVGQARVSAYVGQYSPRGSETGRISEALQTAKFENRRLAQEQAIWIFQGAPGDAGAPFASLIADSSGSMYGTTEFGGNGPCNVGCGAVYKVTQTQSGYTETVLYNFQGLPNDGRWPAAALVADNSGAFYGTTEFGGSGSCSAGCGTVFKLSPAGSGYTESILYNFQPGAGGANPTASLIVDSAGALYGTTPAGGLNGYGTAFKLASTKSGYVETVLHQFNGTSTRSPTSGLVADQRGTLFGEAENGTEQNIAGSVYSLTPTKSGYRYTTLYSFQNNHDGDVPIGGLLLAASGALIGTTLNGGTKGCNCGTVFKLTPTGSGYKETTLHIFLGRHGKDGASPYAGVIADSAGALYGSTEQGGNIFNYGAVFKLTPARSGYTESILYGFAGDSNGARPYSALLLDSAGSLYGTTYKGPHSPWGTVFKVTQ